MRSRTVPWGPDDTVPGPVDEVFATVRAAFPDVEIARLAVTHDADDDNLWYFTRSEGAVEVQMDCLPGGEAPFLLESDTAVHQAPDVGSAVATLTGWLRAG